MGFTLVNKPVAGDIPKGRDINNSDAKAGSANLPNLRGFKITSCANNLDAVPESGNCDNKILLASSAVSCNGFCPFISACFILV